MKNLLLLATLALVLVLGACSQATSPQEGNEIAALDFSSPGLDTANSVESVSATHVYVSGNTTGNLHGVPKGGYDVFLRRYTNEGELLWGRQFGTSGNDYEQDVAASPTGSVVYVVGNTWGSLAGSRGDSDAFIRKYDQNGTLVWTRQFGTTTYDDASKARIDPSGNLYVVGRTEGNLVASGNLGSGDAFIRKYNAAGTVLWTRQFGTPGNDAAYGVATDGSGNVYVVGSTSGTLGGFSAGNGDAFVRKYNSSGTALWTKQFDFGWYDAAVYVALYSGGVYVTGSFYHRETFSFDETNYASVFVLKLNTSGNEQWRRLVATPTNETATAVRADTQGNAYVTGNIDDGLAYTFSDTFISKYNASGTLLWTRQYDTPETYIVGYDLALRSPSELYLVGSTSDGNTDGFLRRLDGSGNTVWMDQ